MSGWIRLIMMAGYLQCEELELELENEAVEGAGETAVLRL